MNVCVIGGGASGMMCATMIARKGHNVTLYEKNEKLGKKIYITGKGRCNVTNATVGDEFLKNVVNGKKFIMGAITRFNSNDTMAFFEDVGIPLKIERGNRVFPESDKSSDVIKCLERVIKSNKTQILLNTRVDRILTENGIAKGVITDTGAVILADKVIVATGGVSYSSTGSTGDGYRWAKALGHNVVDVRPALVPLLLKETYGLQGLSLKNVCASIVKDGKTLYSQFGEMLFTHSGVSGPIILSLSSLINKHYDGKKFDGKYTLCVDLKPALTQETLDNRLLREFSQKINCEIKNVLPELMPKALVSVVLAQAGIKPSQTVNSIRKEQRDKLVGTIKNLMFDIAGLENINAGIITSGGVDCKQINPKDMSSKIVQNLYFIGEVLDVDALTGGFNLQIAFCTAHQVCAALMRA